MSKKIKIEEKLKNDPRFMPYNLNYDLNYIQEYIKNNKLSPDNG